MKRHRKLQQHLFSRAISQGSGKTKINKQKTSQKDCIKMETIDRMKDWLTEWEKMLMSQFSKISAKKIKWTERTFKYTFLQRQQNVFALSLFSSVQCQHVDNMQLHGLQQDISQLPGSIESEDAIQPSGAILTLQLSEPNQSVLCIR